MEKAMSRSHKEGGVLGLFDDPVRLLEAVRKLRSRGLTEFEVFSPYAIEGIEKAQGLKRSLIPFVTLVFASLGCTLGFYFQYWTSVIDWPLNVGGKPYNSWPAFVPVMFELTVLAGGLATFGALLLFARLPNTSRSALDPSITRDRFAILVSGMNPEDASNLLTTIGAREVRAIVPRGWF